MLSVAILLEIAYTSWAWICHFWSCWHSTSTCFKYFFKVKVVQIFSSWKLKDIMRNILYISQMYKPEYIPRVYLPFIISSQSILFFSSNVYYISLNKCQILFTLLKIHLFFSNVYYISLNQCQILFTYTLELYIKNYITKRVKYGFNPQTTFKQL